MAFAASSSSSSLSFPLQKSCKPYPPTGILYGLPSTSLLRSPIRQIIGLSATQAERPGLSFESLPIKPPSHPTYDLAGVIKSALAEDAGDRGDVTCLATIPPDMEVEAHFLAKENGIVAGIALAEMVFYEVDPTLKAEWSQKDGDSIHKGLQFGKVYGNSGSEEIF